MSSTASADMPSDVPFLTFTTCSVDVDLLDGLPVSLQLVARRLEEEKVLAMSQRVLDTLSE